MSRRQTNKKRASKLKEATVNLDAMLERIGPYIRRPVVEEEQPQRWELGDGHQFRLSDYPQ